MGSKAGRFCSGFLLPSTFETDDDDIRTSNVKEFPRTRAAFVHGPRMSMEGLESLTGLSKTPLVQTLVCSLGSCRSTIELRPHINDLAEVDPFF